MFLPENHLPLCLARHLLSFVISGVLATGVFAQGPSGKPAKRIEPGLEGAVRWKWRVGPSDEKDWGLELPNLTRPHASTTASSLPQPEDRAIVYEVKRGDALILIGKRFGVTVAQIKEFNGLKDDKIRIGQMLKIPAVAEPSATQPPSQSVNITEDKSTKPSGARPRSETGAELENVRLQVFLDREHFSAGPRLRRYYLFIGTRTRMRRMMQPLERKPGRQLSMSLPVTG